MAISVYQLQRRCFHRQVIIVSSDLQQVITRCLGTKQLSQRATFHCAVAEPLTVGNLYLW